MKSKYTQELVDKVCEHIASGLPAKDAAQLVDISEETYYHWQRPMESDGVTPNSEHHPEFAESLKRADALRKQTLIGNIDRDRSWQSSAWLLERIYKKEFSPLNASNERMEELAAKIAELEEGKDAPI